MVRRCFSLSTTKYHLCTLAGDFRADAATDCQRMCLARGMYVGRDERPQTHLDRSAIQSRLESNSEGELIQREEAPRTSQQAERQVRWGWFLPRHNLSCYSSAGRRMPSHLSYNIPPPQISYQCNPSAMPCHRSRPAIHNLDTTKTIAPQAVRPTTSCALYSTFFDCMLPSFSACSFL